MLLTYDGRNLCVFCVFSRVLGGSWCQWGGENKEKEKSMNFRHCGFRAVCYVAQRVMSGIGALRFESPDDIAAAHA